MTSRRLRSPAAAALLALAAACADSIVRELGPVNEPELTNVTDSLRFEATGLQSVNDRVTWQWENTGTRAVLLHRTFIHHGYGILTVDDAAGTRVDSTILQHDLDAETRAGVPGSWTVTLILASARGRVDFQLLGRP